MLGTQAATGDFSMVDEGRIPTPSSTISGANREEYTINGIQFGYCTNQLGPTLGITFNLYESYNPCDSVSTPVFPLTLSGSAVGTALPGGSGSLSCWIVTLDLEGAGEFCLEGDGGSAFPGFDVDLSRDSFGIEWIFNGVEGTQTGPLLSGDPCWTMRVAGSLEWGGTGTYYASSPLPSICGTLTNCGDTGLDTQDWVRVDGDNTGLPGGPGCYFFDGYLNTNGCGGPQNDPFASFYTVLFASSTDCTRSPDTFCDPAGVNSSNNSANLAVEPGGSGTGLRLNASGGPTLLNSGFGYFLIADGTTAGVVVGDGVLCLSSPQGRYNPGAGGARNSFGKFDLSGNFENLAGTSTTGYGFEIPLALPSPPGGSITSGSTWNFQLWYRDLNPGSVVNFTNGVSLTF